MYPTIAVFSTIFAIISMFFIFIFVVSWLLCDCLRDSPVADDANDHNMFELQPMIMPNGNHLRAGEIE